jgi:hypothetical protein
LQTGPRRQGALPAALSAPSEGGRCGLTLDLDLDLGLRPGFERVLQRSDQVRACAGQAAREDVVEHVAQAAHHVAEQAQVVGVQAGAAVCAALEGVFECARELVCGRQARGAGDAGERVRGAHGGRCRQSLRRGLQQVQLGVERVEVLRGFGAIKLVERARELDLADTDQLRCFRGGRGASSAMAGCAARALLRALRRSAGPAAR